LFAAMQALPIEKPIEKIDFKKYQPCCSPIIKKDAYVKIINHLTESPLRADYYSVRKINPEEYINNTIPEKRNAWFVFSKDKRYWRINWDAERRPLKYIGIHTSVTNMTINEMNEYYKSAYEWRYSIDSNNPYVKGLPYHSGHFVKGKEVFLPFHWIIYPDGKLYKGLDSSLVKTKDGLCVYQVAWSLGNWEANCESFSMTFVIDNPNDAPTEAQIKTANCVIDTVREIVPSVIVAPHYQFNSQTNCPGLSFEEWGKKLH